MFTCRRSIISLIIKTTNNTQHCASHSTLTSNLIDYHGDWPATEAKQFSKDMQILKDFISLNDEQQLLDEISPRLRRLPYQCNHWDDAIQNYRELELNQWNNSNNQSVIQRIRQLAFQGDKNILHHVHILDLAPEGIIKPHVDSKRFCGHIIAGLSLLSDSVMRLIPENKPNSYFADILLPKRSLYIMTDMARYQFTHEILCQQLSMFKGRPISKQRRLSLIFRLDASSNTT
ncbi:alpha-ketoglutarate-dependent dioxygenase alkB homolog 7, mitochondrial isoform X2 [Drosophila willistoni]|uniref:alpha-ketoglutarate-dependent dioxygenase alkB homolog 7, mitochondrial isoform X2 n=1 Tax=Drosophila willistoni TaxID=7260 RepID=UPI001F073484|nr:alpha-ketoglutarate-dependent dioxygenase alkB homolog 7, mitochondrial isoform X2 [Drosophila willistoni]